MYKLKYNDNWYFNVSWTIKPERGNMVFTVVNISTFYNIYSPVLDCHICLQPESILAWLNTHNYKTHVKTLQNVSALGSVHGTVVWKVGVAGVKVSQSRKPENDAGGCKPPAGPGQGLNQVSRRPKAHRSSWI